MSILLAYLILGLVTAFLRGVAERRIIKAGGTVVAVSPVGVVLLWPITLPSAIMALGKYK